MHRLLTDMGASIGASAVMVFLVVGAGQVLAPEPAPLPTLTEQQPSSTCLERPLVALRDTQLRSAAQLCLSDGGVLPRVELADATPDALYTTWLAVMAGPVWRQAAPCTSTQGAHDTDMTVPGRLDGAIADQGGRVLLSHLLPGARLVANTVVELLLVEHASSALSGGMVQAEPLITWNPAWPGPTVQIHDRMQGQSRLVGCATFWIRGGAEQTEH